MKKNDIILIFCSASALLLLSAGTLLGPKPAFSENENRYLQKQPEISVSAIAEGHFEKQAEAYLSDHIAGRESWIAASSHILSFSGVSDINGTYLCTDGRLVQRITKSQFDRDRYRKNLQQIADFHSTRAEKEIPVTLMTVPTAASVYKDRLPVHAVRFDESSAFAEAKNMLPDGFLDIRTTLSKDETRDTFFRTDHHWSGYGAFLSAQKFKKSCKISASSERFEPEILTEDFLGTLHSRVLLDGMESDIIEAPEESSLPAYTVTFGGKSYNSLYFPKHLKKKDKYAVYFGGNYAQVDISLRRNTDSNTDSNTGGAALSADKAQISGREDSSREDSKGSQKEKLLILKDSFANSFIPYILGDFEQITMLDTRYYRGNIAALSEKYDRVLLLYSITSLAEQKLNLTKTLLQ